MRASTPFAWRRNAKSKGTFRAQPALHPVETEKRRSIEAEAALEPDNQLVQQCLRGENSAWEQLVQTHTRRVYNLCYRFTGDRHVAEDLTQDVFVKVFRTLRSYSSAQGAFTAWMTSLTRNLLIDNYRRTKRDRITDSIDDEVSPVEEKSSAGRRPDQIAEHGELQRHLQIALGKMSPELREAVILRDLQGYDYREIQEVLSVPEGTVKSRINRGRIELARLLEQMGVRAQ
jgi:RNA polymerase sigma-70 factor (ECF subfamily)